MQPRSQLQVLGTWRGREPREEQCTLAYFVGDQYCLEWAAFMSAEATIEEMAMVATLSSSHTLLRACTYIPRVTQEITSNIHLGGECVHERPPH